MIHVVLVKKNLLPTSKLILSRAVYSCWARKRFYTRPAISLMGSVLPLEYFFRHYNNDVGNTVNVDGFNDRRLNAFTISLPIKSRENILF